MPFKPNDQNINRAGRPKGSVNNATKIKQEIQSMLADVIHNELSTSQLEETLKKSSPSARLRFITDVMPFIIPRAEKEDIKNLPLDNIEIVVKRDRDTIPLFAHCPDCGGKHQTAIAEK